MMSDSTKKVAVQSVTKDGSHELHDVVALEEPLEIQLRFRQDGELVRKTISITMRTPGHDHELAAGFLHGEGIVRSRADIESIEPCGPPNSDGFHNTLRVDLQESVSIDLKRLERNFYTSSSCGVCGKTSIEALRSVSPPKIDSSRPLIRREMLEKMPATLRRHQDVFETTGGLHASALFDDEGNLIELREDVGRHNALDKLIGSFFLRGILPLGASVLLLSGRASFELLQKAIMAGIPVVAAIGAPSSLAIELADEHGVTLIGFLREERFNVYSGGSRLRAGAG